MTVCSSTDFCVPCHKLRKATSACRHCSLLLLLLLPANTITSCFQLQIGFDKHLCSYVTRNSHLHLQCTCTPPSPLVIKSERIVTCQRWIRGLHYGQFEPLVCEDGTKVAANIARSDRLCTDAFAVSGLWQRRHSSTSRESSCFYCWCKRTRFIAYRSRACQCNTWGEKAISPCSYANPY